MIYEPDDGDVPLPPDPEPEDEEEDDDEVNEETGAYKVRVSGVPVRIIAERVEYLGPDGTLITASYRDFTRKQIQSVFASLDEFLQRWHSAKKKQVNIDLLEEHGILLDNLAAEVGKDYGDFDLIARLVAPLKKIISFHLDMMMPAVIAKATST